VVLDNVANLVVDAPRICRSIKVDWAAFDHDRQSTGGRTYGGTLRAMFANFSVLLYDTLKAENIYTAQ
jgi:hypothetical protein